MKQVSGKLQEKQQTDENDVDRWFRPTDQVGLYTVILILFGKVIIPLVHTKQKRPYTCNSKLKRNTWDNSNVILSVWRYC